jgi:hypothetical protein
MRTGWKLFPLAAILGLLFLSAPLAQAQWGEIVLHNFCSQPNCTDGAEPLGSLIFDGQGNLYGTTHLGGNPSCSNGITPCGTVFEVTPSGTETVLHNFEGVPNDGSEPDAGLVMDANGNFYGTTAAGGNAAGCTDPYGCGTVFQSADRRLLA